MTTYSRDGTTSDKLVGLYTAFANTIAKMATEETGILSYLSPNLQNLRTENGMVPHGQHTYNYKELQYRPTQTTLGAAITVTTATNVTLAEKIAKPGDIIVVGDEAIELGATTDYLTFAVALAGRGVFTGVAATHLINAEVLLLGKPYPEHSNAPAAGAIPREGTVTTYTQNLIEVVDVADGVRLMEEWAKGNGDKLLEESALQMINLRHQLENCILWMKAQAPVGRVTAGRMDGGYERVAATSYTDLSDDNIQYSDIQTAVRSVRRKGGKGPLGLLLSDYQAHQIDTWMIPYTKVEPSQLAQSVFGANVSAVRCGDQVVDLIPSMKLFKNAVLVTPQNINVGPKSPNRVFHPELLGKAGDYSQIMLVGEYTCEWALPYSHYWFKSVKYE